MALANKTMQNPPSNILNGALSVLHFAGFTTRNWTLSEEISRSQINDLWEAIHEIPSLVANWTDHERCERELENYLNEYCSKWDSPNLLAIYKQARDA